MHKEHWLNKMHDMSGYVKLPVNLRVEQEWSFQTGQVCVLVTVPPVHINDKLILV